MTQALLTREEIKSTIRSLGFDEVGVSRPHPQTFRYFRQWIEKNRHGEMSYLARRLEERQNPTLLLDDVRSAIVVAKRYLTVHLHTNHPKAGIVSRYAWGADYHEVIGDGLSRATQWLRERTHGVARSRYYVDTGPLLERDLAAQAGIGWFGKHTNLLSRRLGNWFFLGVILTTLEIEPDAPVSAHCGTCQRCLDACPTNAFISPYVLDARRCISYLTIELKGPIPRDLRPLMGARIFGCDDCLEVCPWNRFAQPVDQAEFYPRDRLNAPDLIELLSLDQAEFSKRFRGSPVKRTKRRGLLRNVAVALGNVGDSEAVPALTKALSDSEALIRGHAAWALGRIGGDTAKQGLRDAQRNETDPWVLEEIALAL